MNTQITTDIPLAQQILAICKAKQLKYIVISPGSRNAPLTIGFSNDSFFKCFSIVDERCAAFFALGIAQQIKEPVALVCTSGSALLNYYPAVAEAFYSDIPLVILSADRPKEHIDIGDGQTIRQENVFANHIEYQANLLNSPEYTQVLKNKNTQLISEAIDASNLKKGPVHVNIPLYEPLYGTIKDVVEPLEKLKDKANVKNEELNIGNGFLNIWNSAKKKMVLVGVFGPNNFQDDILDKLLSDPSVILFTETTSNLHHFKAIPSIDQLISKLSEEEFRELQPDLLVTFGGLVVSKKIKAFLRKYSPKTHWHIDAKKAYNTYGCLTSHVKTSAQAFFSEILNKNNTKVISNYQSYWLNIYEQKLISHASYLKNSPYSDLKVFEAIINKFPQKLHLQLSNSSTIRYTQLFKLGKQVEVFCNRGTSGIDGSTSTAIGASIFQKKPTLLITGDLSFLYDSNGLWNNYISDNFKIIVINNSGGGIFRILPGNKEAEYFSKYLETVHDYRVEHLAKTYGFNYLLTSEKDLNDNLNHFFSSSKREILEIKTPRKVNDRVLLNYFS